MAPTPIDPTTPQQSEIQGNILAGFNNDHQRFLFLRIDNAVDAKVWIAKQKVAYTDEVRASNDQRKADLDACKEPTPAFWLNIAFNYRGLNALGAPGLKHFPADFREGMASRSIKIGDLGVNDPSQWDPWATDTAFMHVLVLLAADDPVRLETELTALIASLDGSGLSLIHVQAGEAPPGEAAPNEHFGFRDGISQPGVRNFTVPDNPADPNKGRPGQDLLWAGEFVLGYNTQIPLQPVAPKDPPNPDPGDPSKSGPDWTVNGSYLVFRKLQQDVAGFRNSIRANAISVGVNPEVLGAKIVGRYRSGCPMEQLTTPIPGVDTNDGDPSVAHPEMLDRAHNVLFEYGGDVDGNFLPRSGHIRKAYPRDEEPVIDPPPLAPGEDPRLRLNESATQTHRIMRRGIPFGSYMSTTAGGLNDIYTDDQISRGLLFLCYQRSIMDQFEFIQSAWVNNHNFPNPGDGVDPVMSQVKTAPMRCPFHNKPAPTVLDLKHFVTTNGGDYFFQPSRAALHLLTA